MNQIPYIYTVRFDLDTAIEVEANQWANTSHIQDLLDIGILSAVRYKSIKGIQDYLHTVSYTHLTLPTTPYV